MRKFGWASPFSIRRLTDRQIFTLAFMETDDEGNLVDRQAEEAPTEPEVERPKTAWQKYLDYLTVGLMFGYSRAEMDRMYREKYGEPPAADGAKDGEEQTAR